jgi:hypothetical protein
LSSEIETTKNRDYSIDILKGFATISMVLAHVIAFAGQTTIIQVAIQYLINLFAFPLFIFSFGYTTQMSYFGETIRYKAALLTAARLVLAYYISALTYFLFIEADASNIQGLWDILTFNTVPLFSEFIVAFALTLVIALPLGNAIKSLVQRPPLFFVVFFALLLTTYFPYEIVQSAQLGLLVGAPNDLLFPFPVLQYLGIYLLGYYCAYHQVRIEVRLIGLVLAIGALGLLLDPTPDRFPPSFGWITSSLAFVLICYVGAQLVERWLWVRALLAPIGANSLFQLLFSNIFLFAFGQTALAESGFRFIEAFGFTLFLVFACQFCTTIARTLNVNPTPAPRLQTDS